MSRILLLAATTGYQTRAFGQAAERLGVELVFATDRCRALDDPWRDHAVPVRFHAVTESVDAIVEAARWRSLDGILVVGDRPTVIAAQVAQALGLPWHRPASVAAACNKQLTRERLREAGLPVPWFRTVPVTANADLVGASLSFPCVVKPLALSGSRGVMRADDHETFREAFARLCALLRLPAVRAEHNDAHNKVLVEGFVSGREFAVEGLVHRGALHVLAVFDKPDPLDGPFFEETIYLTPSSLPADAQKEVVEGVSRAVSALGLSHGPIHAECRLNERGVYVLEVAARSIGGLCALALRFEDNEDTGNLLFSLEELLLRHALGESPDRWRREPGAAGVMMIPIPRRGVLRGVSGVDAARAMPLIEDIRITAKEDQLLVPLPEGPSYLGFIFARAAEAGAVDRALREAHASLRFTIDPELPVLQSQHV